MARGAAKQKQSKASLLTLFFLLIKMIFLLVRFVLIKTGSLPISFGRHIFSTIIKFFRLFANISKIPLPPLHLPSVPKKSFSPFSIYSLRQNRRVGRPKKFRLPFKVKVIFACLLFLVFITAYTFFLLTAAYQLPTPTRLASSGEPLTSEFYDRNGNLLLRLYEGHNRSLVKLEDVPKELIQATIAVEDQNFYKHLGIDFSAIARALYSNMTKNTQEGASTLTQQLIKNSLLTPEKSYTRKIREALLALWAEQIYTKDQILQMYFNEAPYGGSIMGIAAAAQTYFNKTVSNLNLAESAYLAGLPASPTKFSPYGTTPDLAKTRQKEVLERMIKMGYISKDQADKAYEAELTVRPLVNSILAPHFVFYVRDYLSEKYGSRIVSQGGLRIYTSLDLNLQKEAEKIVREEVESLSSLNVQNGAAMVLDAKTGQILAMVGSRDYHYPSFGNYNVALSLRQPGSSVKPITYAAAFEKGFTPNSMILDTPVAFRDQWGNSYSPVNYDGTYKGPVTLRQALGNSLNIPAVKLLATIGIDSFAKTAGNLGITTFENPSRFGLAVTLGSAEIKMIEMMGVYEAFSQNGRLIKPTGILKVTDSGGNVLEEYEGKTEEVISPQIAWLITSILSDDSARKMAFGTNSLLNIKGFQAAVKTGTSDSKRDNWTFGYTPKYIVGVWVGNPDNSPMNPRLASGITGAAPIWNKIMHKLLDGTVPLAFERPAQVSADGIGGVIPKAMVRIQKKENSLIFSDAFGTFATSSAQQTSQTIPTQPSL